MPPDVDALYRFVVTYQLFGNLLQNVLFFRGKETDTHSTLEAAVNALRSEVHTFFVTPCMDRMSHDVELKEERCECVAPLGSPFSVVDFVGTFGAVSSPALPSYCAAVISWQTGISGRRTHGRTYIPGMTEEYVTGNELTDGALTQINNIRDSFIGRFGLDGSSEIAWGVVFSRKNGLTRDPGPPPVLHYSPLMGVPIRYGLARKTMYTQRHRLQGRGM